MERIEGKGEQRGEEEARTMREINTRTIANANEIYLNNRLDRKSFFICRRVHKTCCNRGGKIHTHRHTDREKAEGCKGYARAKRVLSLRDL